MPLELGLVFILGLGSSLHCVQMCAPIVLAFSLPSSRPEALRAQVHYNAGRILTYAALGALAGALGGGIGLLGRMAGLASGARVFAGSAMIVARILTIGLVPSHSLGNIQNRGIAKRFSELIGQPPPPPKRKFPLPLTPAFPPSPLRSSPP